MTVSDICMPKVQVLEMRKITGRGENIGNRIVPWNIDYPERSSAGVLLYKVAWVLLVAIIMRAFFFENFSTE